MSQLNWHCINSCSYVCLPDFVLFFVTWKRSWRNKVWICNCASPGSQCSCLACFAVLNGSRYWCCGGAEPDCLSVCGSVSEVITSPPMRFLLEEGSLYFIRCLLFVGVFVTELDLARQWVRLQEAAVHCALWSVFVSLHFVLFIVWKRVSWYCLRIRKGLVWE